MADIRPFRGYLFRDPSTGDGAPCAAPPYDVIDGQEREAFTARSPANVVHLTLPEDPGGGDRYAFARQQLEQMVEDGRLVRDSEPRYYLQVATYPGPRGETIRRTGVLAVIGVDRVGSDGLRGHEQVMPKPLGDRYRLLEATRANLEPVFLMVRDPERQLATALDPDSAELVSTSELSGVRYELRRCSNQASRAARHVLSDAPLYIADGHHRCTVAARFHAENGNNAEVPGSGFRLAVIVPAEDPGLIVLPTHRFVDHVSDAVSDAIVRRLEQHFALEDTEPSRILAALDARSDRGALCIWLRHRDRCVIATPRASVNEALVDIPEPLRSLDVVVLHRFLFDEAAVPEPVACRYVRGEDDPLELAVTGNVAVAVFLRAPDITTVLEVSDQHLTMPPKSTYFHPKLASGQVLFRLDEPLEGP